MYCLGYTSDHRRCRLKKINERTCKIHRNYYTDWLLKHPLNSFTSYSSQRKINELIFQLNHGHVSINQQYITDNFSILHIPEYIFLVNYAYINPLWHLGLFNNYIESSKFNNLHGINLILTSSEVCLEVLRILPMNSDWELILDSPSWRYLMCSPVFSERFPEKHKNLRTEQERNISKLKEELLSYVWNPERFDKWKHEMIGPIY
jgi:hypothetical protein